jgi:hypothetical protein
MAPSQFTHDVGYFILALPLSINLYQAAMRAHEERNAILMALRQDSSPVAAMISHHLKEVPRTFGFYESRRLTKLFLAKKQLKELDNLQRNYVSSY